MAFLDYATLKLIWWLLVGILLVGFAVMDGHDMGAGILLPFIGKDDNERRVIINTVAPHWEGNQVWFITAGGAIFAAWPAVYAAAFSGFYWALLLVLFAMFFRPVGFKYRSLHPSLRWRGAWDWGLFAGSFVPALVFGVAFGNLFLGVPFYFDAALMPHYSGSFWALLNPFALLCGVVSAAMLTFHGGVYVIHRTEGVLQQRARRAVTCSGMLTLITFALAGIWLATGIEGYTVVSGSLNPGGVPDPLLKAVIREPGAWLGNYSRMPATLAAPVLGFAGIGLALWLVKSGRTFAAFWASALGISAIIFTAGVSLFPFILPSSQDPRSSLTAWDAVSSPLTLALMLVAVVVFLPLIMLYTRWAYRVMRGKVTPDDIRRNDHTAY